MEKKRKYQAIIISITVLVVLAGIATAIYFGNSKEAKEEKPDKELMGIARQGDKAYHDGDLVKSLSCYSDFINKAERHPKTYGRYLVDAYYRVSLVYASFNDTRNALKNNLKAYEMSVGTKYYDHLALIITNIVVDYTELGNYEKARWYNQKLLSLKEDKERALCYYYITYGDLNKNILNKKDYIEKLKQVNAFLEKKREKVDEANILNIIAECYRDLGQDSLELEYLEMSFRTSQKCNNPQVKISSTRSLLDYYLKKNDEKEAMPYCKLYLSLLDSSMSARKFIEAKNAQEQYEQQKAEKNIQNLNITISKQRLRSYIIIAAFIIALIIIAIIVYQNRKLQAAYRVLYKKNIEVMGSNKHDGKKNTEKNTENTAEGKSNDSASQPSEQLYARILKVMEDPHIYCDPDFSLSKLAEMLGSNVTYVSKAINEHYGQNVRSFVNSYRIGEACRKISNAEDYGNLTLQAIGLSVGYNTQVNFNRAFKQITGMTPSVFQKMAKEANDK